MTADFKYRPPLLIAVGAVFPPVCAVVVGLRFYARRLQGAQIGIDDWLVLPALILVIGIGASILAGVGLKSVGYATPPPIDDGSSFQQRTTREILFATDMMQILALGFIKLSFIFLFRRIFNTGSGGFFNLATFSMVIILIMWTISFFFAYVFICGTHFYAYYGSSQAVEKQYCVKTTLLNNGFAISDVIMDIMTILLPIPMIWKLQMSVSRRIAVTAVFSVGAFTVAASITRMAIYTNSDKSLYGGHIDIDVLTTRGIYWSMLECGVGLIAACLPVLYRLLKTEGVESMIHSIREIISLRSLSPQRTPPGGLVAQQQRQNGSQASDVNMISRAEGPTKDRGAAASSMELENVHAPRGDEILVTRVFDARERIV